MPRLILVTGGAGYIGSHTVVELFAAGYDVVVLDNFSNSSKKAVERVEQITGRSVTLVEADVMNSAALDDVFTKYTFDAVVHFAALKAVGESVSQPLRYYQNNVTGTLNLLEAMARHNVFRIVFSSSATVYGDPSVLPIPETHAVGQCTNPYGKSKYFVEEMLADAARADARWGVMLLRYFNPIGAHPSGLIGEDPLGPPNNLVPYVAQVAGGRRPMLSVYGDSYATPDGTGVRDYIHVVDLAKGHVAAIARLLRADASATGTFIYNLGSGRGYSVLEVIKAYELASGRKVPYTIVAPRAGDVASCYADPTKALAELGWKTELGLDRMCTDSWNWQFTNPLGYASA